MHRAFANCIPSGGGALHLPHRSFATCSAGEGGQRRFKWVLRKRADVLLVSHPFPATLRPPDAARSLGAAMFSRKQMNEGKLLGLVGRGDSSRYAAKTFGFRGTRTRSSKIDRHAFRKLALQGVGGFRCGEVAFHPVI